MTDGLVWRWEFLGFESAREGRPVQLWFDRLPEDAKDEISDLLGYLQNMTHRRWGKPEFDPLEGEGGISELRPRDISQEQNGKIETVTYRIYGCFGSKRRKHSYIFLHGTIKTVRNDKHGKRIAKDRFEQLEHGEATVHEFEFKA